MKQKDIIATFSIVGFDPETEELGIAVQSKFIGVGSVVPWAKAGVGAIATQSLANTSYGPKGLNLLESGMSPEEVLKQLTDHDEDRGWRQIGIVDGKGNSATYTGDLCYEWAGGKNGPNFAAQGNILVNRETVDAMENTFEKSTGPLSERLLQALDAAQNAGGDKRGRQSAALYVVKEKGGYGGYNDRYIDLRVDDHSDPIQELIRLYHLRDLYFGEVDENDQIYISDDVREIIIHHLTRLGYSEGDQILSTNEFEQSFESFVHTENFEERHIRKDYIDQKVLDFLKNK
ncbi:fimbrial assembly protein FimA [Halalkalibacillus sediminis]|uniref:Fimbrial assembly protein FimA n=1 Tax=Halalkalibacillus sediminis TaxID=2018042 RepID=A0A2I0QVV1_9BACI|nr:DUF1028 domain-containing protein [Halalkalibacillus sediminis]PKR78438.1 fimbrial assembly protein FimA [Halalkalibacillus sediminis]